MITLARIRSRRRAVTAVMLLSGVACSRGEATPPSVPESSPAARAPAEPGALEPIDEVEPIEATSASDPAQAAGPKPEAEATPTGTPGSTSPSAVSPEPSAKSSSIDDAKGATQAEVVARWGEPTAKEGSRWIYHFPRDGCVDRRIVYTLHLRRGAVTKVERHTERTGEHCLPVD